jgi:hypothetical protein
LSVCDRYDTDWILFRSERRLRIASHNGDYQRDKKQYRAEVIAILNYLDGVAIGISQGLYIEALARGHMEPLVEEYCEKYHDQELRELDIRSQNYRHLKKLRETWAAKENFYKSYWRFW